MPEDKPKPRPVGPSHLIINTEKNGELAKIDVFPQFQRAKLPELLTDWRERSVQLGHPLNLFVERFGIYLMLLPTVAGVLPPEGKLPERTVLTVAHGDPWNEHQAPHELLVACTNFLWTKVGLSAPDPEYLAQQTKTWVERIAGSASFDQLPKASGTMGIARTILRAFFQHHRSIAVVRHNGVRPKADAAE